MGEYSAVWGVAEDQAWRFLILLAVLGSLSFNVRCSEDTFSNMVALGQHFRSLQPKQQVEFLHFAADALNAEATSSLPILLPESRAINITGCIDCAMKKIVPGVMGCLSNPLGIFACLLADFDASCLLGWCVCSVFSLLPEIVGNIMGLIGICPRAGAAAAAAAAAGAAAGAIGAIAG